MTAQVILVGILLVSSAPYAAARGGEISGGQGFFDQASRSIDHDKKVLKKLESHPLAHASGWDISETQGSNKVGLETPDGRWTYARILPFPH